MVNWLKIQFEKLLNARKRARYAKTLSETLKFTECDIKIALLLYDYLDLKFFIDLYDGSLYIGKLDSHGHYAGRCIGYCGRNGACFYRTLVPEIYPTTPSSLSELFNNASGRLGEYGRDIPRFKSAAELKMKLELNGKM